MQTYPPEMITGINISDAQIADARALAPSCTFQVMNATKLDFPHNHFDAVICIEGAWPSSIRWSRESPARDIGYPNRVPIGGRPGRDRHCRFPGATRW